MYTPWINVDKSVIASMYNEDNLINDLTTDNFFIGDFAGYDTKLQRNDKDTLLGAYTNNSVFFIKELMQANPLMFATANQFASFYVYDGSLITETY